MGHISKSGRRMILFPKELVIVQANMEKLVPEKYNNDPVGNYLIISLLKQNLSIRKSRKLD